MDDVDITTARSEREEKYLLAAARRPAGPVATGECLYCGERVGDEVRWCSTGCRDAWAHEDAMRRTGGA